MGSDGVESSTSVKGAMKDAKNSFNRVLETPQNGVGVLRKTLKSVMKSAVDSTNKTLASIEESTQTIRKPIVERANTIGEEGKKLVHQASNIYAVRQQYGLENIAGSTVLGALVGLRRGRIPALTIGSISGFLAYIFVYQVDARHLPSKILGRK
eukprot:CAMPEP_0178933746 /NCGR_PEP_ID=MMETSP0786-20121207/23457_1 /TAXON_ID=186022 /ORGANISM="Thalassionema frauenfeldii, Strain CCMP 1798" /LENGTH=153 /DNA_ID=CAMNT_0020611409 /DNA_START=25 /DNA_END=486 /DNA_ORIENTATION=+